MTRYDLCRQRYAGRKGAQITPHHNARKVDLLASPAPRSLCKPRCAGTAATVAYDCSSEGPLRDRRQGDMSYRARRPKSPLNPEFASAIPTNGFGEIETNALASLSSFAPPRPLPATPKPARKMCRIFSPVSSTRSRDGSLFIGQSQHARPHTADVPYRPRIQASTGKKDDINIYNNTINNGVDSVDNSWGSATGSSHYSVGRRPVTSDSSTRRRESQLQHNKLQGANASGGKRGGVDGVGGGGELRPSTSGRGGVRSRGGLDSYCKNGSGRADAMSSRSGPVSNGQRDWRCRVDQQAGHGAQDSTRQQPVNLISPPSLDEAVISATYRSGKQRKEVETPPNRYWPSTGGPKEFLCPFIERNRTRLWAYDAALIGMDHVQAYRHIVNMGNFQTVRRMLLEKEDALVRGTGSITMADTINRQRGCTPRGNGTPPRATTEPGPRPWLHRTPPRPSTAIERDSFQCGGRNRDKLRREEARRRELSLHAAARNNAFCRRKGYEPGDFLKVVNSAPIAGGSGGGRKISHRRGHGGTDEWARLSSRRGVGAGGCWRAESPGRSCALL